MPKLTEIEKLAKFDTIVIVTKVEYSTCWKLLIQASKKRALHSFIGFSRDIASKMMLMSILGIGFDGRKTEIIFNNIDKVWDIFSQERAEA